MRTKKKWEDGVKERYIVNTFPPRIVKELKEYPGNAELDPIEEGLYLYGQTDTGKTLTAARMLVRNMQDIYIQNTTTSYGFFSCSDLFMEIKSTVMVPERVKTIVERLCCLDILILDDIGTIKPTEWVYEIFYTILNRRYENLKKTVITSNYSLNELSEQFGGDQRLVTRIKRMCKVKKMQRAND
jgi:DNA replication protein DnaC/primosomal protein DnaI